MTWTPSELARTHEAIDLLDALLRAADVVLTPLQYDRAASEADGWLANYRRTVLAVYQAAVDERLRDGEMP